MDQLSLKKPAGVLVKTTCVDYPGMLAGSFFLKGCNLLCPYCYNKSLVLNLPDDSLNSLEELFEHMEKRQGILKGFVISGGEPCINPNTKEIIKKAKTLGYKVKLDTNGCLPEELANYIYNPELKPDFIAMDIKTSPEKYSHLLVNPKSPLYKKQGYFEEKLKESIKLITNNYESENREWRTVLVPTLINKEDIENIATLLPEDASWQFAQFQNKNCINEEYNHLLPYSDMEVKQLIDHAKSLIQSATLR